ncbi:MAG: hypothetical protein IT536_00750 [Hyphomicrobiales bacterium]|nr:hypothetical protein [Hyphomicrobiales bacterium]
MQDNRPTDRSGRAQQAPRASGDDAPPPKPPARQTDADAIEPLDEASLDRVMRDCPL